MKKLFSLLALGLFLSFGSAYASTSALVPTKDGKECIEQEVVIKPTETWTPLDIQMKEKGEVIFILAKLHNPLVKDPKHVDAEVLLMAPKAAPDHMVLLIATFHNEKNTVTFKRDVVEKTVLVKGKKKVVKSLDKCFTRVEETGAGPLSPDKAQKSK